MKKAKGIDGKLDEAWSELVKLEANYKCEYCSKKPYIKENGRKVGLQSHHIYTRSNKSTRWDTMNGTCLCPNHHTLSSEFSAHKTSLDFRDWLYEVHGEEYMNELRIKAHSTKKWFKWEKEELLEELKDKIKKYKELENN